MSPKTTGWGELHLAENPAVEMLESLGYTYVPPEALEGERASFKETILTGRLAAALKRLNPWLSEALLRNSRSRRTGPRSSSASAHALRSWHSKLRHPVQHSALDRGFDFLVLDRAGREAYPEYRLVP